MNHYRGKRTEPEPARHPARRQEENSGGRRKAAPPSGGGSQPPRKRLNRWQRFYRRHRKGVIIGACILIPILLLVLAGVIWWVTNVRAPDIPTPVLPGNTDTSGEGEDAESGLGSLVEGVNVDEELPEYISNQKDGVYTFLLIGRTTMDDNSDMMMLVVFDSNTGEVDACSIPRDTMINISSDTKKINAAIWGGVDNLKNWVRKTLGVYPNFYVMVDWQAVGDLVEAVGGIYYDVPCRMYYVDSTPGAAFKVDLEPGYQKLNGDQAMQLLRWRHNAPGYEKYALEAGFDGSNTKRTEMQQDFLVQAAKQILQVKNLPYIGSMVQVFKENVETDLTVGNLAWFAQTALTKGSANKVEFHTLPADYSVSALSLYSTYRNGTPIYLSYVTMYGSRLVSMVNENLNPYESDISLGNLDLMSVNSDGTISSSTGSLADTKYNTVVAHLGDIQSGLAYLDSSYNVIYYETEDPENPDGTVDPENPDGTVDPDNPGEVTDPDNPGGAVDPENPDGTGTTGDGGQDPGATTPENPDGGTTTPENPGDSGTATDPDGSGTSTDSGSSGTSGEQGAADAPADPVSPPSASGGEVASGGESGSAAPAEPAEPGSTVSGETYSAAA